MYAVFVITLLSVTGPIEVKYNPEVENLKHCFSIYKEAQSLTKEFVKETKGFHGFKVSDLKCLRGA